MYLKLGVLLVLLVIPAKKSIRDGISLGIFREGTGRKNRLFFESAFFPGLRITTLRGSLGVT